MKPLRLSLFALLLLAVLGLSQEAEALNHVPQVHNIDDVWQEYGIYGEGVTIAILDTGIDNEHVSLDDMDDDIFTNDLKVAAYYDATRDALICQPCLPGESIDSGTHGTHVAGIVAGTGDGETASDGTPHIGVAPKAELVNVLVCCDDFEDVIRGMEWVTSNKDELDISVALIAISIEDQFDLSDSEISALHSASKSLVESGIVLVGPTGTEFGGVGASYGSVGVLGSINEVVTVGAVTKDKTLATYSAMGPTDYGIIKPNVVAVGGHIMAPDAGTGNGYTTKSGTSMSVAVVAGISALIIEANPDVTPNEIRIILETTSEYSWSSHQVRPNNEYGWGIVDAYNAVDSADSLSEFKHIAPSHSTQGSIDIVNYTKSETDGWNLTQTRYQVGVGTGIYFDLLNTDEQIVCNLEIDFSEIVEGSDYCEENPYFFFEPGNFSFTVRMQIGESYTLPFYFQVEVILVELPDLFISTIDFSNNNPEIGDVVTINATIKVIGANVTDNFSVGFYLGDPFGSENGTEIGFQVVNGSKMKMGIQYQYFVSINWTAIDGTHAIYVVVDSTDVISESEEKNELSKVITVGFEEDSNEPIPGAPTAIAGQDVSISPGGTVQFSGAGTDEDGSIVKYEWDFDGDGVFEWSSEENGVTTFIYNTAGTYTATLRVTDDNGKTATDSLTVTVKSPKDDEGGLPSLSLLSVVATMSLLAIFRRKN